MTGKTQDVVDRGDERLITAIGRVKIMQSATVGRKTLKKQEIEIFPAVETGAAFLILRDSVTQVTLSTSCIHHLPDS
jgi:hypothetical protein